MTNPEKLNEHDASRQERLEFFSAVNHELRTPLTSIRGALGLLNAGMVADNFSAETRALMAIAYSNCDRMVRVINDMLDIAKIEAGKMPIVVEPMPISILVRSEVAAIRLYAEQFGVTIELKPISQDIMIKCDADRLAQALTNLLSSAVAFSAHGDTVVVAAVMREDRVRVSVTGRSAYMRTTVQPRLFEADTERSSSAERIAALDPGFAVAERIIADHGGIVGQVTGDGNETSLYFELPGWRKRIEKD